MSGLTERMWSTSRVDGRKVSVKVMCLRAPRRLSVCLCVSVYLSHVLQRAESPGLRKPQRAARHGCSIREGEEPSRCVSVSVRGGVWGLISIHTISFSAPTQLLVIIYSFLCQCEPQWSSQDPNQRVCPLIVSVLYSVCKSMGNTIRVNHKIMSNFCSTFCYFSSTYLLKTLMQTSYSPLPFICICISMKHMKYLFLYK